MWCCTSATSPIEDSDAQSADVQQILRDLGIEAEDSRRVIEVWNKVDLLDEERREALQTSAGQRGRDARPAVVSALTGAGLDVLLSAVEERLAEGRGLYQVAVGAGDGKGLHWLYEHAEIIGRQDEQDGTVRLTVRIGSDRAPQLLRTFADTVALDGPAAAETTITDTGAGRTAAE